MDSNTHSTGRLTRGAAGWLDELGVVAAAVDGLAAQELNGLSDAALAGQVLGLRRLVDRLEGSGSSGWPRSMAGGLPG